MAGILRLRDIDANRYYLNAWTNGKVSCPNVECKAEGLVYEANGLGHHYRIKHSKSLFDGNVNVIGKERLQKLLSEETLENLKKLSDMRTKQEDWQRVYELFTVSFSQETVELAAANDKEAAKLFGLYLYHKGNLQWLEEGNNAVSVSVKSSRVESTYNLWRNKEKIYAEATSYKKLESSHLPRFVAGNLSHQVDQHRTTCVPIPYDICEADKPLYILKTVFGYETFRAGQLEAIQTILSGDDCVILMPTGGGKSMIYVISAIIKQGLTVIIEPLKFLMEEQVRNLREKGIPTFYFNSSLKEDADNLIHFLTRFSSQYIILFTSPECIFNTRLQNVLNKWKSDGKLGFIAVDEAHCIDAWGVGFRPSYTRLGELKKFEVNMAAITGTATPDTVQFIITNLALTNCKCIKTSFLRNNIFIEVLEKKDKAKQQVAKMISERFQDVCGIVYCTRRQDAVEIAHQLKSESVTATYVHGALSDIERAKHLEQWTDGNALVMCATKCFGMGIDKPDVRFVVHFTFPSCLEEYYQEIGRAGRDGQPATCISLFKFENRSVHLHHIFQIDDKTVQKQRYDKLNQAADFFSNSSECRHSNILSYFGEETPFCEDMCDLCIKGTVPTEAWADSTTELAKLVIHCLMELLPHCQTVHISVPLLSQVLMGSVSVNIITNNLDKLNCYGKGKTLLHGRSSMKSLNKFIYKLIMKGFIREELSSISNKTINLNLGNITELLSGAIVNV